MATQQQPRTWELSMYELNRTPQEAITDGTEITVSPRTLHSELMCPICLDMLRNTMTTKECLHRFCQECITRALRNVNRECPTCRKKLVSRRSLRPDPNFDALIAKIYPSRDEYEAHQERMMMRIKEQHNTKGLTATLSESCRLQQLGRNKLKRLAEDMEGAAKRRCEDSDLGVDQLAEISGMEDGDQITEVELVLRPHPNSACDNPRYIKTTGNATVYHLSKFVAMREWLETHTNEQGIPQQLPADHGSNYSIYVADGDAYSVIGGSITLDEVMAKHWESRPETLTLFFKQTEPDPAS